jgi:calcineurin-like phosphoesterase family protein
MRKPVHVIEPASGQQILESYKPEKWFTGDEHHFHNNMIKGTLWGFRDFPDEKTCRREIIKRHNEVVSPIDEVYHIGDFAMIGPSQWEKIKGILDKLNGTHYLILGNHDECKPMKYVEMGFTRVHTSLRIEIDGWILELHHDPSIYTITSNLPDVDRIVFIHGHVHTLYKSIPEKRIINVGVDQWDYHPINWETIKEELKI